MIPDTGGLYPRIILLVGPGLSGYRLIKINSSPTILDGTKCLNSYAEKEKVKKFQYNDKGIFK